MSWSFYDANGKLLQGVLSGSIGTGDLADGAVTTVKILDANVTVDKMAVNSINSDQYVDRSIDTVHIGLNQVTVAEMAGLARGSIIYGDSSGDPTALALGASGLALKSDGTDLVYGSAGVSLGLVIALGG